MRRVTLRLYDTATREVRDFAPLEEGKAGIYLCGLTVQSEPHVGHVRSGVNFDVLQRWLRHRGYDVTFIRNVTDIDDKILVKAAEQGRPWYNLAYEMHRELDRAYAALNVAPPTYEPAATGHVPEMLELIGELVATRPRLRRRGRLRRRLLRRPLVAGVRRADPAGHRRHGGRRRTPTRAASATPATSPSGRAGRRSPSRRPPPWPSPWGPGRPGWHIECSAMAGKYLGQAFDIHGGGVDLRFPHHENEQAQSRAAGHAFASYWMHNAWITTAGEKMSKSLGNSLTIPAVLTRFRGIELRYYLVAAHYRSHVEFSFEALEEAAVGFRRVEGFLDRAAATCSGDDPRRGGHRLRRLRGRDGRRPRHARRGRRDPRGGRARATSCSPAATRPRCAAPPPRCSRCSTCSGSHPQDAAFAAAAAAPGRSSSPTAVDALVRGAARAARRGAGDEGLRRRRRDPRPDQGRRHRDRRHPHRPEVVTGSRQQLMAGNSQRKGAIKKTGKGNPTAGSGGRVRRGLEGRGPTPKAKDRPNHKVYKQRNKVDKSAAARPQAAATGSTDAEWVAGRNSVVEALREGVPVTGLYVAEGAERDGRLREAFRLAAERGIRLLEVSRGRARPDDRRRRAPGPRRADPVVRVRPPRRPARPGRRGTASRR